MRRGKLCIAAIAFAGFVLRAVALTGAGGPNGAPSSYDDGVYFSASALLVRGVLPYRDFVFVHPPGIAYFLAIVSWLGDAAQGFAAAHVLATIVGAANIALAGFIALRAAGPFAGVIAALLYALYPDAVLAERNAYLEPVLNLFALSSAWVWLRREEEGERPWLAGVLCGVACAVKFWGGIWLIAAGIARMRGFGRFVAGAALAGVVLLAPFALTAPSELIEQTLRFQLSRPPDGTLDRIARIGEIFGSGHRTASLLAIVAIAAMVLRRRITRDERFFVTATAITIAGFLASSSYWTQYNSHLAASECVLAGIGAAALFRFRRVFGAVVLAAFVLLDGFAVRDVWRSARVRSAELLVSRDAIRAVVPRNEQVFAFDATWALTAGHLPPHGDGAPVVVDSYGAMLSHANGRFPDTASAFRATRQPSIVQRLDATPYAVLGWRGLWQLHDADRAWFASHFRCVNPEAGDLCVWKRTNGTQALAIEEQTIRYVEGWYDQEGVPPKTWRWMSGRSVTSFPPSATAWLRIELAVPLDSLRVAPLVTIEIDGKVVDQFRASTKTVAREYRMPVRRLVITTDGTFVPAQSGASGDTRELGLRLTRLAWRGAG